MEPVEFRDFSPQPKYGVYPQDMTVSFGKTVRIWILPKFCISGASSTSSLRRLNQTPCFLLSEKFACGKELECEWRIHLNPDYSGSDSSGSYLSLYLGLVSNSTSKTDLRHESHPLFRCIYILEILNSDGESVFAKKSGLRLFRDGDSFGWKKFISRIDFNRILETNNQAESGLYIRLQMSMTEIGESPFQSCIDSIGELNESEFTIPNLRDSSAQKDNIVRDGNNATSKSKRNTRKRKRDNYSHKEIIVVCNGNRIKINKSALVENSPVLHRRIEQADKNVGGEATNLILEEDTDTLKTMLLFFVKCQIIIQEPITFEKKISLLNMAIKYEVIDLQNQVLSLILRNPTVESTVDIALVVFNRNMELDQVQVEVEEFKNFLRRHRTAIRETKSFKLINDNIKHWFTWLTMH